MPKLLIINVGETHSLQTARHGSHPLARATAKHLWMAEDGDVVLHSGPLDKAFVRYAFELTGVDIETVECIEVDTILNDAALDSCVLDGLSLEGFAINACYMTPAVARLQDRTKAVFPVLAFAKSAGSDLLNRKANFRRIAAGFGLPIPPGEVFRVGTDLKAAVERLLRYSGSIILKSNSGAGGEENYGVTLNPLCMTGARFSCLVNTIEQAQAAAQDYAARFQDEAVIEAYLPSTEEFYLEYHITSECEYEYLTSGRVLYKDGRPESGWSGLELPYAAKGHLKVARALADPFIRHCALLGYRGYINLDAILTEGQILFNETNARWGGGTASHELFKRLYGADYSNDVVLRAVRDIPAMAFSEAKACLDTHGLSLCKQSRSGAVLLSGGGEPGDQMEVLIAGRDEAHIDALDARLRQAFLNNTR